MVRVKNVSRTTRAEIKQVLRFRYEDGDKLPALLPDILCHLKAFCPDLITDGSKPLRAVWAGFQPTHLEVIVTTHHNCMPIGQRFWENRQKVNEAIYRAVQEHKMQFETRVFPGELQN